MIRSIVAIVFIGIVCTNDIEQDVDYFDEEILNGITRQESSSAKDETMHRAEAEDQRVERYLNNLNEDNDEKSVTPKDYDLKAENLSDEDKMTEDVQLLMENVGKETENEFEREKKSAFWGRRRRTGRRRSSRRRGTGECGNLRPDLSFQPVIINTSLINFQLFTRINSEGKGRGVTNVGYMGMSHPTGSSFSSLNSIKYWVSFFAFKV